MDSGATMLTIPEDIVTKLGLVLGKYVDVKYADCKTEKKRVAYGAKVSILDREGTFDCVVESKGAQILIGQLILEEFDLILDLKKRTIGPRPESPEMPLIEHLKFGKRHQPKCADDGDDYIEVVSISLNWLLWLLILW